MEELNSIIEAIELIHYLAYTDNCAVCLLSAASH